MPSARDIVTRALRRARVIDASETATAEDAASALAALDDMLHAWPHEGVICLHQGWTLEGEASLWIPPASMGASAIDAAVYSGGWNASTNSPALTSTGTAGTVYRVTTAGSTSLGGVASWAVGDHLGHTGTTWLKGRPLSAIQGALVALLADRLMSDFGKDVDAGIARDARIGWQQILSMYVKAPEAQHDTALRHMPADYWSGDEVV